MFSEGSFRPLIANLQHIKNVLGRKKDIKGTEWLAQLGKYGLIQASYLSDKKQLALRHLTRRRQNFTEKQTQWKKKLHNVLQPSNIKLTNYLSEVFQKQDKHFSVYV